MVHNIEKKYSDGCERSITSLKRDHDAETRSHGSSSFELWSGAPWSTNTMASRLL